MGTKRGGAHHCGNALARAGSPWAKVHSWCLTVLMLVGPTRHQGSRRDGVPLTVVSSGLLPCTAPSHTPRGTTPFDGQGAGPHSILVVTVNTIGGQSCPPRIPLLQAAESKLDSGCDAESIASSKATPDSSSNRSTLSRHNGIAKSNEWRGLWTAGSLSHSIHTWRRHAATDGRCYQRDAEDFPAREPARASWRHGRSSNPLRTPSQEGPQNRSADAKRESL